MWSEGDAPTEHTRAFDALMDAERDLIHRAIEHAYPRGQAVLVMPRHLFERAAAETGRVVSPALDAMAIDTVVGPLEILACVAMVVWAGLPDPMEAVIVASAGRRTVARPTVLVVAVVELPTGPRVVVSVVSVERGPSRRAPVDAFSTEKPRGDA